MKKIKRSYFLVFWLVLFLGFYCLMAIPVARAADKTDRPASTISDALRIKQEGDSLLKAGDVEDAITAYRKAIAKDSSLTNAWFNLAIACYGKRDLDGARGALEALLLRDNRDTEAHYNLGCMYLYQGYISRARQQFVQAMQCERLNPLRSGFADSITKAMSFLHFFHSCSPEQRHHLLRLMQDGLEPMPSAALPVVF